MLFFPVPKSISPPRGQSEPIAAALEMQGNYLLDWQGETMRRTCLGESRAASRSPLGVIHPVGAVHFRAAPVAVRHGAVSSPSPPALMLPTAT